MYDLMRNTQNWSKTIAHSLVETQELLPTSQHCPSKKQLSEPSQSDSQLESAQVIEVS